MHNHTLDVTNDDSLKLIENMLEEFIPLFNSDKFNICCDETFDLGKGKSSSLAKEIGTGKVYITFLNKVIDCTKQYGKKVMFWGDIILKHPELLSEIPRDVTCLNWAYHAAVTEDSTRTIAETGLPLYVCPGVAGWNRLMNDMDTAFTNITKMIAYGKKYGAALSWNPEDKNNIDLIMESISTIEYGADSKNIVSLLRDISNEQVANWADIVWWMEKDIIDSELSQKLVARIKAIDHHKVAKAYYKSLELEKELLKKASKVREERKMDVEEFIVSTQGVALVNALFLVVKKYSLGFEQVELVMDTKALAVKFEYWFMDYSRVWRLRNKESELGRIRNAIRYISNFLRSDQ